MKRIVPVLFACVLIAGAYGVWFYVKNLRGAHTAFLPSQSRVEDVFEGTEETPGAPDIKPSINTTGFPLKLPENFSIELFAKGLGSPRVLSQDPKDRIVVSIPPQGKVIVASDRTEIVTGLKRPHGIAFYEGYFYVAEEHAVSRYRYNEETAKASGREVLFSLPTGGNHWSRTIGFGPDGKLYTSIGSSCNVCIEKDRRRGAMLVSDSDGKNLHEFVSGLRNAVFFSWSFVDQRMWATEMGRDLLGDNIPPDEINIIRENAFYGWPYCYGKNIHDVTFDKSQEAKTRCQNAEPSFIDLQAHSAPLGLAFIPPQGWPEEYGGDLLVAFHGSWNRTEPTGYKIVRLRLDGKGNFQGQDDFLSGWLSGTEALGRPVDILALPGGVVYVSDDKAGVVYRVTYQGR